MEKETINKMTKSEYSEYLKNKNKNKMKIEVNTVKTSQLAIPELNRGEKQLYYLTIGEGDDKIVINVGEKTHLSVLNLISEKPKKAKV